MLGLLSAVVALGAATFAIDPLLPPLSRHGLLHGLPQSPLLGNGKYYPSKYDSPQKYNNYGYPSKTYDDHKNYPPKKYDDHNDYPPKKYNDHKDYPPKKYDDHNDYPPKKYDNHKDYPPKKYDHHNDYPHKKYDDYPHMKYDKYPHKKYNKYPPKKYDDHKDYPHKNYDHYPHKNYDHYPNKKYDDYPHKKYDDYPHKKYDSYPHKKYDSYPHKQYDSHKDYPPKKYDDKYPKTYHDKPTYPAKKYNHHNGYDDKYPPQKYNHQKYPKYQQYDQKQKYPHDYVPSKYPAYKPHGDYPQKNTYPRQDYGDNHCYKYKYLSAGYKLSDNTYGYPEKHIMKELETRPYLAPIVGYKDFQSSTDLGFGFSGLPQLGTGLGVYSTRPSYKYLYAKNAYPTDYQDGYFKYDYMKPKDYVCPSSMYYLREFYLYHGKCWVINPDYQKIHYAKCRYPGKPCQYCGDYKKGTHRCDENYTWVSVWAYCDKLGYGKKIQYIKLYLPIGCSCKTYYCN